MDLHRFAWAAPALAGGVLCAVVTAVAAPAAAGPMPRYAREESHSDLPSQNRLGVGVVPRIGIGAVPRTGIGSDLPPPALPPPAIGTPSAGVASPTEAESPATIRAAQRALEAAGLAPDTNGIIGPRTRQAIRTYQESHNLPVTGTLDNETRQRLGLP